MERSHKAISARLIALSTNKPIKSYGTFSARKYLIPCYFPFGIMFCSVLSPTCKAAQVNPPYVCFTDSDSNKNPEKKMK
jgi:hypothetical protein